MQADVCDFDSLQNCITSVQALYNPIHTAAVVSDATIQTVSDELFELVFSFVRKLLEHGISTRLARN